MRLFGAELIAWSTVGVLLAAVCPPSVAAEEVRVVIQATRDGNVEVTTERESGRVAMTADSIVLVSDPTTEAASDNAEGQAAEGRACESDACDSSDDESCEAASCDADEPAAVDTAAAEPTKPDAYRATHRQTALLKVNVEGQPERSLTTFCLAADGRVVAACSDGEGQGDVRLFTPEGSLESSWEVPFEPEAINYGSDDHLYVAGGGKLARFTLDGVLVNQAAGPHVESLRNNRDKVRESVIESRKRSLEQYQQIIDSTRGQIEALDRKIEAAAERAETQQDSADAEQNDESDEDAAAPVGNGLFRFVIDGRSDRKVDRDQILRRSLESQLKIYERMFRERGGEELTDEHLEQLVDKTIAYKARVASISEADGEVFIATSAQKGYGYAVWRMSRHFDQPKEIVTGLSGCCGQMDVQACCDGLFVAENSRDRVVAYDRKGELKGMWGKSGDDVHSFAPCCNPMNLAFGADGSVYTAESTIGRVKRYSPKGDLIELVGKVELVPGCKKVSIAVGEEGDRVYMLDMTRNHIIVLQRADESDPVAYTEAASPQGSADTVLSALLDAVRGD